MKMLDVILEDDQNPMRFEPVYLSDHVLDPALFIIYTIMIGLTVLTCLIFPIVLVVNREVFSFSFTIILVQIILCGLGKILTRTISYFGLTFFDLYSIELMFDFGVLLFITLMTINRLLVIATPKNCFIHSNKALQVAFVLICWLLLAVVLTVFRVGQCVRSIQDDKRMYDTCFNLFYYKALWNEKFGNWLGPIIIIRQIVVTCYDVLPLFCLSLYVISALVLMVKRRAIPNIQSHQHVEWRIFFHGFVIFAVYGLASIINIILELNKGAVIDGALAQFVMFVYVILDVTTILCIPLVVFITVPAVRTSPSVSFVNRRMIELCRISYCLSAHNVPVYDRVLLYFNVIWRRIPTIYYLCSFIQPQSQYSASHCAQ
ncbi:hypothetical protein PRIPAC_80858 [Pristionchus pacificus]|uniref:Uncharacterized protein n=1 Tax=Pristionchus pacificus TaxID=54126 RepID=A0A2A6CL67_PRIPA|nr:hypothetical protein PRIPAC_80858 [Pristionchus pacificus]|eukprot:PDM78859.1 hypothetical protein PRIPAC_31438 [Pristionchus pacificus]